MSSKQLLSQRHPVFYFLAVWAKRIRRYADWYFGDKKYAKIISSNKLPFLILKHQSVLIRKLGDSDIQLQINKITNLKIAIKKIDGLVIRPGETFSFCKLVGLPSKRKGYLPGLELTFGEAKTGIGGGLCQISNMLYWMTIHSPLTVVERHHHSFDPFPDDGRILPFGSGATVFYNYRDFQFTNNTTHYFQINLRLSEKHLEGELSIDEELDYYYRVFEKDHQFLNIEGVFFRKNEIWREKKLKSQQDNIIETELITKNFARVSYTPDNFSEPIF
jgi:vancomycin resistance protein VanW